MQMPGAIATPVFKLACNLLHRLMPVDEMMNAVEFDHADKNEINGDDVVEQPRHDQNQDAGKDGDPRSKMRSGDDHDFEPFGWAMRLGTNGTAIRKKSRQHTQNAQRGARF